MPFTKVCPKCFSVEHCRRSVCTSCGYVFVKSGNTSKKYVMREKRASETVQQTERRIDINKQNMAKARANETVQQSDARRGMNKQSMAKARANEMVQQSETRRGINKQNMAKARANEMVQQSETRRGINKQNMAKARANETVQQTETRRGMNKQNMAKARANEMVQQSETRRGINKQNMAKARANETVQQTETPRDKNKQNLCRKRANETVLEADERRAKNRHVMANARAETKTVDAIVINFVERVKRGPEYVCTCCHRMMYKHSAVLFKPTKYTKANTELLSKVSQHSYVTFDGNEWVCKTCNGALIRGLLPLQAKANGMELDEVPPELSCLNPLERRLISLRVPFMKMVALPSGKQRCIHGPAVNVPSKLDRVCTMLPRLPSQCELVPLKLKRKLSYKGHYMYDYVSPERLTNALVWLKANNPLYADVDIADNWLENAIIDDEELVMSMLGQPDEPMDECNDGDKSCNDIPSESNQPEPMDCSIGDKDSNTLVDANHSTCTDISFYANMLEAFARKHGFLVHDIGGDGDCLFCSVAYQLQSIGYDVNKTNLRQMVATYLSNHGDFYSGFVHLPVVNNDGYNADNEPPNAEDAYIESLTDPLVQRQLLWQKYLKQLRQGAWGDDIVISAICNMFDVNVNVFSARQAGTSIARKIPNAGSGKHELNIGLVMQFHFAGLDKIQNPNNDVHMYNAQPNANECNNSDNASLVQSNVQSNVDIGSDNIGNELDDETIAAGDEHRLEITGGTHASMLTVENLEQVVSIAPAEGQKPLFIMSDPMFELMCNPDKFSFGKGGFANERQRKLTYRKYFNARLLDIDGRFARDLDYLFVAQYIVESKQVVDDGNNFAWRQKPSQQFTASEVQDRTFLSEHVRTDRAYRFLKNVRGSPPYYQRTFYELLAMIRQLGTPTWFFTLSAADLKWPDMIQIIARQYGVRYSDEDVRALSFEEKCSWLRHNPVTAAKHFQYRLSIFFQEVLQSSAKPLGEVFEYGIRIEFQARGSPHAHCVLWVKDAPKYGVSKNDDVCTFIDKYISCAIPATDCKLKDLVLLLQQHKHSSYCKRNKQCRFNFPHPPSPKTIIAEPCTDSDAAHTLLSKVRKVLPDCNNSASISDVVAKAGVTLENYVEALQVTTSGTVVILKRKPNEQNINNYNASVMLAWQANMDVQYVLNAYACVMYVASYIMKTDRAMGVLLKQVAAEVRTDELKTQLRKIGSAFLNHREVSAQEVVYRILSLPMKQLSRSVVYVDTNAKKDRIAVLKSSDVLKQLDSDDTNVFQKSLIDRYQHRPQQIKSMCLAEFAATYCTIYNTKDNDGDTDALPATESEVGSTKITLTGGYGQMHERKKQAVIRFRKYSKDADVNNWYRAKLMLYFPWYDEQNDLLGGYSSYAEHYEHVKSVVCQNEQIFTLEEIEDVEIDEDSQPEHAWCQIAPSTEESRSHAIQQGAETITELSEQDLVDNAILLTSTATRGSGLSVRFESAANPQVIAPAEYRKLIRGLNRKQRAIIMYHRHWCKQAVQALKNNKPIEPYRVFLSGPGGVGKSHVIKLVQSDTISLLRQSGAVEPDDVLVLLTAPTGVAAFNVSGMTLHSAFLLGRSKYNGFQPLSHDRVNTLRSKLSKLTLLIIDEVSMVGANMLLEIHKRLQQIKAVLPDVICGGVSILAVGDLYQLPPVGQSMLFSTVSDSYAQLYKSGSLWQDEFQMLELDEIMRQRGDSAFADLLCRVRTASCTDEDIAVLKSRVTTPDTPGYPSESLHVYRLNADVDEHNGYMLNQLATISTPYEIKASDTVTGQTKHIDLASLSNKRTETGGLHGVLKIACGARIMLTTNVDVSDGLVNGARGEIALIVTNTNNDVTTVLVKFDNAQVGVKACQSSQYRTRYPNAVPLSKIEVVFLAKGKRGAEITRLQFPLTLAWATTIHKVQGLTLDDIVVDMKGTRYNPGQIYVALSRVKTLTGLHIINFNAKNIKKSTQVDDEMARLRQNLLQTMPQLQCLPCSSHVTLALLNVRSIIASYQT